MDDSESAPDPRKPRSGTSALIIEWWREDDCVGPDEHDLALRGNIKDLSRDRRTLGSFAGFDKLVTLLRRLVHEPHD